MRLGATEIATVHLHASKRVEASGHPGFVAVTAVDIQRLGAADLAPEELPTPLNPLSRTIAEELLKEIRGRLGFLTTSASTI